MNKIAPVAIAINHGRCIGTGRTCVTSQLRMFLAYTNACSIPR